MFKTFKNLLKHLKEESSKRKKLEKENDLLKAKLKLVEQNIMRAFMDGNTNTWTLVQVVLYDMYKSMEIVDYGTFIQEIAKRITSYDQDKKLREEKINQFTRDFEFRQKIMRGGNANFN